MSEDLALTILNVFLVASGGGREIKAGQVEYHKGGRLSLLDVHPQFEHGLRNAIDAVNHKLRIVELVPNALADHPFVMATCVTERTDSSFMLALNRYMRRYHGFGLG